MLIVSRNFCCLLLVSMLTGCCLFGDTPIISGPDFLGPDDFSGSFDELQVPIPMGGQSNFTGDVGFTNIPRSVIEDILPDDLKLAVNTNGDLDHPVILLFGVQHNLQWVYPGGWSWPIEQVYNEIMLIVPFVQKDDGNKWHNWVARMYLDWQWAVDMGNTWFGLQKEFGDFARNVVGTQALDYRLNVSQNGIDKWKGEIVPKSAWMNDTAAESSLANYKAFKQIFAMPMLGQMPVAGEPYICSYFSWDMNNGEARHSEVNHQFLTNFRANMNSWIALGPLQSTSDGGFGLKNLRWRMTTAFHPCRF